MNTKKLLEERGKEYGEFGPKAEFVQRTYHAYLDLHDKGCGVQHSANHAVYLILHKLSRIAMNKSHADSWDDIAGYAELGKELACGKEEKEPEMVEEGKLCQQLSR